MRPCMCMQGRPPFFILPQPYEVCKHAISMLHRYRQVSLYEIAFNAPKTIIRQQVKHNHSFTYFLPDFTQKPTSRAQAQTPKLQPKPQTSPRPEPAPPSPPMTITTPAHTPPKPHAPAQPQATGPASDHSPNPSTQHHAPCTHQHQRHTCPALITLILMRDGRQIPSASAPEIPLSPCACQRACTQSVLLDLGRLALGLTPAHGRLVDVCT